MYSYSLGLYEKAMPDDLSLTQKLLLTRELGYDYMEFCVDLDPRRRARLDWSRQERRELVSFLLSEGLRLTTLSLSALRASPLGASEESAARFLNTLERGAELACDLGAQVMLFNGYDIYDAPSTAETRDRFRHYLPQAANLAAKRGVVLGIENAEREVMDSVAKVAAYVREVDSPYLRVYGDVANTANAVGGDVEAAMADLEQGRGLLAAIHLKDSLPGEYRFTPYGAGHVDFPRSVAKCRELGVAIFTAELFQRPDVDYRAEAMRVGRFLRSFFRQSGGPRPCDEALR